MSPRNCAGLLARDIFAYANVPYRIKPYEKLLENPKDTVVFDAHLDKLVRQRVQAKGADGKLLWDKQGHVRLVNLTEKLLVPLLVKLSNFIPGAGIWLNTQRPEWNDANNALVGNGASMVTLYYLRRYLTFCQDLLRSAEDKSFALSAEVAEFLEAIKATLERHRRLLAGDLSDAQRRRVADDLGRAGSEYRRAALREGLFRSQNHGPAAAASRILRVGAGVDESFHPIQPPTRRALSRLQPGSALTPRPGCRSAGFTRCSKARSPCSVPASSPPRNR